MESCLIELDYLTNFKQKEATVISLTPGKDQSSPMVKEEVLQWIETLYNSKYFR